MSYNNYISDYIPGIIYLNTLKLVLRDLGLDEKRCWVVWTENVVL